MKLISRTASRLGNSHFVKGLRDTGSNILGARKEVKGFLGKAFFSEEAMKEITLPCIGICSGLTAVSIFGFLVLDCARQTAAEKTHLNQTPPVQTAPHPENPLGR